jgi:hypothetical protein
VASEVVVEDEARSRGPQKLAAQVAHRHKRCQAGARRVGAGVEFSVGSRPARYVVALVEEAGQSPR